MSVESAGWQAVCDDCRRPFSPPFDDEAEARQWNADARGLCAQCNPAIRELTKEHPDV